MSFPPTPQCKNAVHSFMQVSIELNFYYFFVVAVKGVSNALDLAVRKCGGIQGHFLTSSWWDWKATLNLAS